MRFRVTLKGRLVSDSTEPVDEEARGRVHDAFAALNKLGGFPGNAAVFLTASSGEIEIECGTEAGDRLEAVKHAAEYITDAMTQVGIGVPRLPGGNHPSWTVEWVVQTFDAEALPDAA